jgi:hypothetical protein
LLVGRGLREGRTCQQEADHENCLQVHGFDHGSTFPLSDEARAGGPGRRPGVPERQSERHPDAEVNCSATHTSPCKDPGFPFCHPVQYRLYTLPTSLEPFVSFFPVAGPALRLPRVSSHARHNRVRSVEPGSHPDRRT